jgi:hypothetical protein
MTHWSSHTDGNGGDELGGRRHQKRWTVSPTTANALRQKDFPVLLWPLRDSPDGGTCHGVATRVRRRLQATLALYEPRGDKPAARTMVAASLRTRHPKSGAYLVRLCCNGTMERPLEATEERLGARTWESW